MSLVVMLTVVWGPGWVVTSIERTRIPSRCWRRHSRYIESTARAVAMRSAVWSWAEQAAHQARMSVSEGAALARRTREALAGCQPHRADSSRPVIPASRTRCTRRPARASRATWALEEGDRWEENARVKVL